MIIDAHAHISATDYGNLDLYIKEMEKSGVDKSFIVPGGSVDVRQMTRYIIGDLEPKQEIANNVIYDALEKYPDKFYGLVCVNPLDESAAIDTFKEGISRGCVGLKLSPLTHQFAFSGDTLYKILEICQEEGIFVYAHTLYNPGASTSMYIQLAEKFPDVNFLIGHGGFGPADVEAMDAASRLENFYIELSLMNLLALKSAYEKAGSEKIIFGSEFPMSTPEVQLQSIKSMGITASEEENILYKNILRIAKR